MNRKSKKPSQEETYHLQVVIEIDEDDKYVAWCPALQGCYTQGDTFEEAMDNVPVLLKCV